ncbi:PREDICTED: DNA polymerase kappa [Nanorana parkeri]|uniref:DNA polymerase kappa n=1 Tax=Nanorana parkeri TaxID=125878 RepID=UPI0008547003|nr:PREDICTED: DNA polymerase kappa [Nanorana parkeri]
MDQQDEKETPSNNAFQYRMGLNDNKAGMEGLDKQKINKIIMDATKGSRFYENELKKDQQVNRRIEKMLQQKALLTSSQISEAHIQVDRMALELERRRDLSRVIVHVDMDAFYAAVEMRENPELKEKPMAVGSMSMLSTSNYLARRFGVRAAMPGFIAKKLCPNLIIVPLNFDKYREVSKEVREVFAEYDPNFLPLSLDEAYLDITNHLEERLTWPEERRRYVNKTGTLQKDNSPAAGVLTTTGTCEPEQTQCTSPVLFEDSPSFLNEQTIPQSLSDPAKVEEPVENVMVFGTSAEEAVNEMRFRIEQKTSLTASAGIAPNMMLAKVCSDKNKPNGQYVIPHDRQAVMDFIKDLPIRKVPGIGKVTEKMLQALGITDCTDLYQQRALLSLLFSDVSWHNFLHISLGLGSTRIEKDGERKSMSTERTFNEISSAEEQYELCRELCKDLAEDLHKEGLRGRTVTLKLKNVKFEVKTRASTVSHTVSTEEEIFCLAKEILKAEIEAASPEPLRLRLMGVRVSGFTSEEDRKHQKSITSFLCANKPSNKICSEATERTVQERPATCPQRESFFNQKRAARQQELLQSSSETATTSKDQNVIFALCEEPKAEADDVKENPDFTCPICLLKQGDWDLEGFNKHIDKCLSKSPSSGVSEMPNKGKHQRKLTAINKGNGNDIDANNLKNKMVTIAPCDDLYDFVIDKYTLGAIQNNQTLQRNLIECNSEIISEDTSNNMVLEKQAVLKDADKHIMSTPPGSSVCMEESTLICPVCNTQQDTTDLAAFNRHVDICLNKGILEELKDEKVITDRNQALGDQNGSTGRGNTSNKSALRSKRPGTTQQNPASKKAKINRSSNTIERFFK